MSGDSAGKERGNKCPYCAREIARRQEYERMLIARDRRIKELEAML